MNEITRVESAIQSTAPHELSVTEVVARVQKIKDVMSHIMVKDVHYGAIPGAGDKPTLLKPGAEILAVTFQLSPTFQHVRERNGNHLTVYSTCILSHVGSGRVLGTGSGSCSTRESKYAWRKGGRKCPKCAAEAIIKSKFGPGWVCFQKKNGCGAKFSENDKQITEQDTGRVENPDIADIENTVVKMADKRSLIAATLIVTGASSMFTQDFDEYPPNEAPFDDPQAQHFDAAPEANRPDVAQSRSKVDDFADRLSECTTTGQVMAIGKEIGAAGLSKDPRLVAAYKDSMARIGAVK